MPTPPRPAASVILVRDGDAGLEVLLVQRNPAQRLMGGVWVFPGGTVDAGEGEDDAGYRAAAIRELEEEAGVAGIDAAQLVAFSRWITPEHLEARFDTHFFLAVAPPGVRARCDGIECVDLRWISPRSALDEHGRDDLALVFPTIKHLEAVAAFERAEDLLAAARARKVQPVLPRMVVSGKDVRILLPGEPGYDAG